jgi:D-amino-acid dehydrogenase
MEQGLRVVGTVEFGGLDNPLSKSRVKNLINNAKYMLGDLPEHEDEWLGFRPSLPDFLPVMGPFKKSQKCFLLLWSSSFRLDIRPNIWKDSFRYDS